MSEKIIFLEGRLVNLRPLSRGDALTLTRWINDPRVREFLVAIFPRNEEFEEDWIQKLGCDERNIVLGIETKEGTLIGTMGIHEIIWRDRACTTGALLGEKEYWGKGYGTDAKMILLNYIFNTLNMRKVLSRVIAYNRRSLNYSLHCGYKIEGTKRRQLFSKGKYWDMIELGLFKEEWLPIWKRYKKTGKVR